jgi:hypothetical protein
MQLAEKIPILLVNTPAYPPGKPEAGCAPLLREWRVCIHAGGARQGGAVVTM